MNAINRLLSIKPRLISMDCRGTGYYILRLVLISSLATLSFQLPAQNQPLNILKNSPKKLKEIIRIPREDNLQVVYYHEPKQVANIFPVGLSENSLMTTGSATGQVQASIRLKKYGLALKLFYLSFLNKHPETLPDWQLTLLDGKRIINIDCLFSMDTLSGKKSSKKRISKRITVRRIMHSFKDGKKAIAYGLLIHIKQPVAGTRKRFKWFESVGHSFITLSKYNHDGSIVSCTYGYYPHRSFILQGTPLLPVAHSQYKNDAFHDADETIGKLITARQFYKILRTTKRFAVRKYHLNNNNCTDFVLKVASIAGIKIQQTQGRWPLGGGNDPGDTGQSILENKIKCDCGNNFLKYVLPELQLKTKKSASAHCGQ